jgi:HSP20 family protein
MELKSLLPTVFTGKAERDSFRSLQRQIDQVFSDFTKDFPAGGWLPNGNGSLAIDVAETDKMIEVSTEIPGVDDKDISVTLAGDMLTIRAEKKTEKDEKGKDFHRSERSYGVFERCLELPFKTESSKVDAKYDKGVLRVTIAKPAEVQALSQKIPVKVAA